MDVWNFLLLLEVFVNLQAITFASHLVNLNTTCPVRTSSGSTTNPQLNQLKQDGGGWKLSTHNLPNLIGPCTIQRFNLSLSQEDFLKRFAYSEPVILVGVSDQSLFRSMSTHEQLLLNYGHDLITVTTANANSYPKVRMTLQEYIQKEMKPQSINKLGSETLYHFGDNDREAWKELFSLYQLPPYYLPNLEPVLSFGLAGPGTGVPFHVHGPTFAETIYGRKRWLLYPPYWRPRFDPNVSSLQWLLNVYPRLPKYDRPPMECVLHPGELLYFPDHWWHMTVNIDTSVFMSTFLA